MLALAFTHNSEIEDDEPAWSSIDKAKLPRMAFADHGEPDKKSTWKYPHHWVKNGGEEDENGVYTSGTLYLHEGGWQAAINAAHGARSGQESSQEVMNHLESHRTSVERKRKDRAEAINQYEDTPHCFANHMGMWCIEPLWLSQAVSNIQAGIWKPKGSYSIAMHDDMPVSAAVQDKRQYDLFQGVAILPINGAMMKAESKFGGCGTVQLRQMIRAATKDPDVKTILMKIDSPGGHVAGTQELADEIWRVREHGKNILAHIDDLGASAAYWAASQTMRITANEAGEIGSIGTIAILVDTSGRANRLGVYTHVISTGKYKGVGTEGASISSEDLTYIQSRVNNFNGFFHNAVKRGRNLSESHMVAISDGQVYGSYEAKKLGLIDAVMSFDKALDSAINFSLRDEKSLRAETESETGRLRKQFGRSLAVYRNLRGV